VIAQLKGWDWGGKGHKGPRELRKGVGLLECKGGDRDLVEGSAECSNLQKEQKKRREKEKSFPGWLDLD